MLRASIEISAADIREAGRSNVSRGAVSPSRPQPQFALLSP